MNPATKTRSAGICEEIDVAGEVALCDNSGAVYFPRMRLLAVSDLHLEKGSSFARRGSLLPPYDTAATLARLEQAIGRHDPSCVVCLGDSFHDPEGSIRMPEPYRATLAKFTSGRDWFWIAGNHDPDSPKGLPGECVEELATGPLLFRHEPSEGATAGEVSGHLHPCARIVQRGRSIRRRCFATDGKRLIMPAFGTYAGSLNILDRAYAGILKRERLWALMLGSSRIFAISAPLLRPD